MRPSDITDGISRTGPTAYASLPDEASMRPSDITDGISEPADGSSTSDYGAASMRPSDITDGIFSGRPTAKPDRRSVLSFNEAVGYYRRNHVDRPVTRTALAHVSASMRPSDITDGITRTALRDRHQYAQATLQ